MLALTRQLHEKIRITLPDGRRIVVALLRVKRDSGCILGFEAPADVTVDREEIAQLKDAGLGRVKR